MCIWRHSHLFQTYGLNLIRKTFPHEGGHAVTLVGGVVAPGSGEYGDLPLQAGSLPRNHNCRVFGPQRLTRLRGWSWSRSSWDSLKGWGSWLLALFSLSLPRELFLPENFALGAERCWLKEWDHTGTMTSFPFCAVILKFIVLLCC